MQNDQHVLVHSSSHFLFLFRSFMTLHCINNPTEKYDVDMMSLTIPKAGLIKKTFLLSFPILSECLNPKLTNLENCTFHF